MTVYQLQFSAKFYTSKEHGTRLIFDNGAVNPRDILGKIGVTFHNKVAAVSRSTISINLPIHDGDEVGERVVHFNRSSLFKYIQAYHHDFKLDHRLSDADLVDKLKDVLVLPELKDGLRHAGQHNKRQLNSKKDAIGDAVRGGFFSWLYQKTIESVKKLKRRFFFAKSEKSTFKVSEILAKLRFKEAVDDVPAYRQHIANDEAFAHLKDTSFRDIPVTSKDNYIKANAQHDARLHHGGRYPTQNKTDTSTGTTGKPAVWVRGTKEVETVKNSLKIAALLEYGDRPLNYINAFALGAWATGMTAYEMMRATGSVYSSGPDIVKILDKLESIYQYENDLISAELTVLIQKLAPRLNNYGETLSNIVKEILNGRLDNKNFDTDKAFLKLVAGVPVLNQCKRQILGVVRKLDKQMSQIIITGYPPFLKDLIDHANVHGIDFKKYHARGVVGGQAMSEALRDKLMESGFVKINSSYGASDCDINIGVETSFEIKFRRILEATPGLARELYGSGKGLPMIFHYDPFNYHIESDADDRLIFTCNRNDRSSPRIRYDLGDKGRVYAMSDIQALLLKYGIEDLKPSINFPLLFVWGRDAAVTFRGAKVSFTDLERASTNIDPNNQMGKCALYRGANRDESFEILIELKEGQPILSGQYCQQILARLLFNMATLNQDFAEQLKSLPDSALLPGLRFFVKGASPIGNTDGHHKQVLVFNKFPDNYRLPLNAHDMSVTVITKGDLTNLIDNHGQVEVANDNLAIIREGYSPRFNRRVLPDAGGVLGDGGFQALEKLGKK